MDNCVLHDQFASSCCRLLAIAEQNQLQRVLHQEPHCDSFGRLQIVTLAHSLHGRWQLFYKHHLLSELQLNLKKCFSIAKSIYVKRHRF